MHSLITNYPYVFAFTLFCIGAFLLINAQNPIRKLFGLGVFQTAVLLFSISLGYIDGAYAPIIEAGKTRSMVNPLPQVLMLTAIVVGIATLAVGLALAVRIKKLEG